MLDDTFACQYFPSVVSCVFQLFQRLKQWWWMFPSVLCVLCVCMPFSVQPSIAAVLWGTILTSTSAGTATLFWDNLAMWSSGQPLRQKLISRAHYLFTMNKYIVDLWWPLNLKMINWRCQTKYYVRFLCAAAFKKQRKVSCILVGRTSCFRVSTTGFTC